MARTLPGSRRHPSNARMRRVMGFLQGAGSILEIAPNTHYAQLFPVTSPGEAMRAAFEEVGTALHDAMGTVAHEEAEQQEKKP